MGKDAAPKKRRDKGKGKAAAGGPGPDPAPVPLPEAAIAPVAPVAEPILPPPAKRGKRRRDGSDLCYGAPITEGGRTIIPVARVRRGDGVIDATPRGYIEVGPEGTRFQPIDDPDAGRRRLRAASIAALTVLGAVVGLRLGRARRAADGGRLLGRGR